MYEIILTRAATKVFLKLTPVIRKQIERKLQLLAENPYGAVAN